MEKITVSASITTTVGELSRTMHASTEVLERLDWESPLRDLFNELREQEKRGIPEGAMQTTGFAIEAEPSMREVIGAVRRVASNGKPVSPDMIELMRLVGVEVPA